MITNLFVQSTFFKNKDCQRDKQHYVIVKRHKMMCRAWEKNTHINSSPKHKPTSGGSPEHRDCVFALAMREEILEQETQCDQIRLMTRRGESMTYFWQLWPKSSDRTRLLKYRSQCASNTHVVRYLYNVLMISQENHRKSTAASS